MRTGPLTIEHRAKIAAAMQGVPKTLPHRQRMSVGAKKSWTAERLKKLLAKAGY